MTDSDGEEPWYPEEIPVPIQELAMMNFRAYAAGITESQAMRFSKHFGRFTEKSVLLGCLVLIGERVEYEYSELDDSFFLFPQDPHLRSESALEAGAKLCELFAYAATKTYENKKLSYGVAVFENIDDPRDSANEPAKWIMKFKCPVNILSMSSNLALDILQLCDASNSILCSDLEGRIHGIIENPQLGNFAIGNYDITVNRHGFVRLRHRVFKSFLFDGFQWQFSWREQTAAQLALWAAKLLDYEEAGTDLEVAYIGLERLLDKLSETRLSSIIAICPRHIYTQLRELGIVSSMRPSLEGCTWESRKVDPGLYFPFMRLDGAHFLDPNLLPISICNRISVTGLKASEGSSSTGSGTNAAEELSKILCDNGVVLKVSSDGPVKIFCCGKKIDCTEDLERLLEIGETYDTIRGLKEISENPYLFR